MTRRIALLSVAATLLATTTVAGPAAAQNASTNRSKTYNVICSFRDPYGAPTGFQVYGPHTTRTAAARDAANRNAAYMRTIGYKPCSVR
jgi:hypothetical protein